MFFEYKSILLSELAKVFSKKTSDLRKGNPFQKIWVVVQNKEAQQWLTLQVAKFEDIAFNFEFILPSELMWKLHRISQPDLPSNLPSDRVAMQLQLFDLIKSEGKELGLNSIPEDDKGIFQLSEQIADVMDLYQVFRPELLDSWERNRITTVDDSENWQRNIWRALNFIWEKNYPEIPNRKKAFYSLKESVSKKPLKESYPDTIFVFGLSQSSSPFLDLITSYAKNMDVHFFNLNIKQKDPEYAIKFNEWQKNKMESEILLKELIKSKEITHHCEYLTEIDSEDILAKISRKPSLEEHLIEVHSCHNPKREVEVLKDYLLLAFDKEKNLMPEDILIMVPEMDEYAPVIESVFLGEENELQIPVYLPNKYLTAGLSEVIAFLELISSKYKIDDVLDFLELKEIRNRFGFTDEDIFILKNWLKENRIHWGLELSDSSYSLEKAVSNFMTGFAIEANEFDTYENFIPYKGISTSEHTELAAKFSFFVRSLKPINSAITKKKSVNNWLLESKTWIYNLFQNDDKILKGLITFLEKLIEHAELVDSRIEIEFNLFKTWFIGQLSENKASSSGFGHGIVVSSYIPYRSIPFKKVCVLGLNEGVFPRNATRPAFDLIHTYPKPGDRIMKEDDKLLFLELLASTSENLFISYLGKDQHRENEKLPSMLVQKMMDELESLTPIQHKLHGFDKSYFIKPDSHSIKRQKLGIQVLSGIKNVSPFIETSKLISDNSTVEMIEINDLISFFVHPCKYIFNNVLSIKDNFEYSEPVNREVFKISALDKYNLDQLIFEGLESGSNTANIKEFSILKGFTPQGIPGEQSFYNELDDISGLMKLAQPYLLDKETQGELDFSIDNIRLKGSFDKVYGKRSVIVKAAKLKAKDFISSWIKYLALNTSDYKIDEMIIIGRDYNNRNQVYVISGSINAREILHELIKWFIQAKEEKSCSLFFPESSKAYVEAFRFGKDKKPIRIAKSKWIGSEYLKGDGSDFYNSLYWRGENPIEFTAFKENALSFWDPVFTHLQKLK